MDHLFWCHRALLRFRYPSGAARPAPCRGARPHGSCSRGRSGAVAPGIVREGHRVTGESRGRAVGEVEPGWAVRRPD
ncbi:hypothetical protein SFR_6547 [Streptomyces sp. FR-008]|nr:hypothetical protein SFR_6547 [Streptomyces sp. FR-008]